MRSTGDIILLFPPVLNFVIAYVMISEVEMRRERSMLIASHALSVTFLFLWLSLGRKPLMTIPMNTTTVVSIVLLYLRTYDPPPSPAVAPTPRQCKRSECYISEDCIICWGAPATRALIPCKHLCLCDKCDVQLHLCPLCRSPIVAVVSTDQDECIEGE